MIAFSLEMARNVLHKVSVLKPPQRAVEGESHLMQLQKRYVANDFKGPKEPVEGSAKYRS
jgi:hypothetical protein